MVGCSWLHTMCQCIEYCTQWSWLFYFHIGTVLFACFIDGGPSHTLYVFLLFLVQAPCHPGASPSRSSSSQWWPVTMMNLANDDPNTTMTPTPQQQPPLEQWQPPYYCLLFCFLLFSCDCAAFAQVGCTHLQLQPFVCTFKKRFFVACFCLFVFLILQLVVLLASGCTWWHLWYSLIVVFTLFLFFSCTCLLALCCWPWKIEINIF